MSAHINPGLRSRLLDPWLNGRRPQNFMLRLVLSCFFILLWLLLTVFIDKMPRSNHIMTKFLLRLDNYLFSTSLSYVGPFTFLLVLLSGSWVLYLKFYLRVYYRKTASSNREDYEMSTFSSEEGHYPDQSINNEKVLNKLRGRTTWKPYNCWSLAPPILLASSWFILNILFSLKLPINKPKNLIAWIFYVILHFMVPIFISIWLYLFHPSGAMSLYATGVGFQNILISLTHLMFPNAPPLFIKLYGENKIPTYDMIYADGITRQDMKFGVRIYKAVYYVTPHKFASLPSLHSSMATLIFLFASYYSRWTSFKLLALVYLLGQWWSALYLDHHWRFDLLVGSLYSIFVFTILRVNKNGLGKVDQDFLQARLRLDFRAGSTMGMRLFKNTRLQNFFDPLS